MNRKNVARNFHIWVRDAVCMFSSVKAVWLLPLGETRGPTPETWTAKSGCVDRPLHWSPPPPPAECTHASFTEEKKPGYCENWPFARGNWTRMVCTPQKKSLKNSTIFVRAFIVESGGHWAQKIKRECNACPFSSPWRIWDFYLISVFSK